MAIANDAEIIEAPGASTQCDFILRRGKVDETHFCHPAKYLVVSGQLEGDFPQDNGNDLSADATDKGISSLHAHQADVRLGNFGEARLGFSCRFRNPLCVFERGAAADNARFVVIPGNPRACILDGNNDGWCT
jgi:hypothetical protein